MNLHAVAAAAVSVLAAWPLPSRCDTPNVLWDATTRGIENRNLWPGSPYTGTPMPHPAAVDASGNLFVVGTGETADGSCMFTVKYAASSGAELWRRTACGGLSRGYGVAIDRAGDVIVTGAVHKDISSSDFRTVKYAGSDGAQVWSMTFSAAVPGHTSYDAAFALVLDAEGNAIVAGNSRKDFFSGESASRIIKYRGSDGATSWIDSGSFGAVNALTIDSRGNLIAAGTAPIALAPYLEGRVVSLRGDGSVAWRTGYSNFGTNNPGAVATDSAGNVAVVGTVLGDSFSMGMRTLKLDASSGAIRWDSVIQSSLNFEARDVKADTDANVLVTGSLDGAMTTLKFSGATGAQLWRSGVPGYSMGNSLAFDDAGNVVVTGMNDGGLRRTDMRTVKYDSSSGTQLWSIGYDGVAVDSGYAAVPVPGGTYVVGIGSMNDGGGDAIRVFKYGNGIVADMPRAPTYQGIWSGAPIGSESGWGLALAHQGDIIFATWYTYDADGSPMWLVMPEMKLAAAGSYSGAVFRATGPAFDAQPWDASLVRLTQVGTASFAFGDYDNGTFNFTVDGVVRSKAIARYVFASPRRDCFVYRSAEGVRSLQDLYWQWPPGSQSGWGVDVAHQGDILFATWFTYAADGRPVWYVMSNGLKSASGGAYAGPLYRARGPAFTAAMWDRSQVVLTSVGTASIEAGATEQWLNYQFIADDAKRGGTLTRYVFSAPASDCR